jgi:nondiscriminating glutamyl-tRNA synthetase
MRVRFAPSPTGQLHVGNVRTALFNWLLARGNGGTFVVRIEDTDEARSTEQSERDTLGYLRWLGLDWSEGVGAGGAHGPYRQSERAGIYQEHAATLLTGGHAYYCFCSTAALEAGRRAALAAGRPPMYSGICRDLDPEDSRGRVEAGDSAVIRLRVPRSRDVGFDDIVRGRIQFSTDVIGDPVLVRSGGVPAYNFAVVVDDALMEITHVIRGEDHLSNTPRQLLLYEAFGWTPPRFAHVSLVMGPDHSPLSKRHGATSVSEFRARGYLPEALVNYLALLGWSPGAGEELLPLEELARRFRLDDVGHSAGVFDPDKLDWVNRHYLKEAAPARLVTISVPYLRAQGWLDSPTVEDLAFLALVVPIAASSADRLDEVPRRLKFLFDYSAERALSDVAIRQEADDAGARDVFRALADELRSSGPLADREAFRAAAARVRERTGKKGKALFHPIRLALTGEAAGVELNLGVPAIEAGAGLPAQSGIRRIPGAAERAARFVAALGMASS